MTFANELKPPIDEAIEHYGVKGMKWGVRKDRSNSAGAKRRARNKQIKTARKNVVAKRNQEIKNATGFAKKAEIFLMGEFSSNLSETYRANPDRKVAFHMTSGEKVALTLTAFPTVGGALAYGIANNQMNKAIISDQQLAELRLKARGK